MWKTIVILAIVGLALAVAAFAGDKAPQFSLDNMKGEKVALADFAGKAVILDFWATWCPPCREEIPHFNELYTAYKDKGLVVLGISIDRGGKKAIEDFLKNNSVKYPILLGNNTISNVYQRFVPEAQRNAIPFTFIIDKKGEISQVWVGYTEKAEFEKAIKKLLAE